MNNNKNELSDWDKALLGGEMSSSEPPVSSKPEPKEEPKKEPKAETKEEPKAGKGVVLLVDDDPLIIRMYQNKLSKDGYKVNTASHGEEAIAQVKKEKPGIILLDVMMPKMNGVETLKVLKADEQTKDIPVIILTNLGDKSEDVDNAKKMGALDYLVKSEISLKELSEKVKSVLA